MSERWKPKRGEAYYFVASAGVVYVYMWGDDTLDSLHYENGNYFKTRAEAEVASEKFKALLLSLHEQPTERNQLPKLTADVFDRQDCPRWARYAAVNKDGEVRVFEFPPKIVRTECWHTQLPFQSMAVLLTKFDASDWQNSLTERPTKENKLPDWCKVGEWVYNKDFHEYIKVVERTNDDVKGVDIHGGVYHADFQFKNTVPARPRPYSAEEMQGLVGKIAKHNTGVYLITACPVFADDNWNIEVGGHYYSAKSLLESDFTIDDSPCGVLEHLSENGEWVE